jgi:hypothetical protein
MLSEIHVDELSKRRRLGKPLLAAKLFGRALERLRRRLLRDEAEATALHTSRVAAAKPVPVRPAALAASRREREHLPLLHHRDLLRLGSSRGRALHTTHARPARQLGRHRRAAPSDDDWYANLIWLERRKCLLLTHAGTLFSVFLPDVRAPQLRPPGPYIVGVVEAALDSEGLPTHLFGTLDPAALKVAKTASRSVLGFMNDMAVHIDYAVASAGGLGRCDADAVSRHLRRTPYNRGGFLYPIDLALARCGCRA